RSLSLRPADSLSRHGDPLASKALAVSLPPRQLRLLPVRTISYRRGSRTHGYYNTFTRRTPERASEGIDPRFASRTVRCRHRTEIQVHTGSMPSLARFKVARRRVGASRW